MSVFWNYMQTSC